MNKAIALLLLGFACTAQAKVAGNGGGTNFTEDDPPILTPQMIDAIARGELPPPAK